MEPCKFLPHLLDGKRVVEDIGCVFDIVDFSVVVDAVFGVVVSVEVDVVVEDVGAVVDVRVGVVDRAEYDVIVGVNVDDVVEVEAGLVGVTSPVSVDAKVVTSGNIVTET